MNGHETSSSGVRHQGYIVGWALNSVSNSLAVTMYIDKQDGN